MKFFYAFISAVFAIAFQIHTAQAQFQYINPMPNSTFHNPETNIILKNGSLIDARSLDSKLVFISGSISGIHASRIILSDDQKTILIYPDVKFAEGETVNVSVSDGFKKKTGEMISGTSFSFETHRHYTPADIQSIKDAHKASKETEYGPAASSMNESTRETCHLPSNEIFSSGNEYDGDVFFYNFTPNNPVCYARSIITNQGDSVYAAFDNNAGVGFGINRNGYLTYYDDNDSIFLMADSTYTVVKQFAMGNGYFADNHEFLVYPNGYSFMFCYDVHPNIDLTQYGGLDSVDVTGLVIQELDPSQNVIFEWSSWDHFQIDDVVFWQVIPGHTTLDYVHGNSMDLDYDGNLLLSSRHLSEITKIDLNTGDIIWRLGGENNQFTFLNDIDGPVLYFSGQHHFRRLPNGNYTMFNNANQMIPQSSTAKEYKLDQINKTATLVWHYTHPQVNTFNVISNAMGSVERLPNGNTFIDYGLILDTNHPFPRFTEVDSAGNIVWEYRFTVDSANYVSYRAFKNKWDRCGAPVDSGFLVTNIGIDTADISWDTPNYTSSFIFQYKLASAIDWISIPVATNSISLGNLEPESVYDYRVQTICTIFNDSSDFSPVNEFTTISTGNSMESAIQSSFKLYPNPAHEKVTLSFDMEEDDVVSLSIRNILGEESIMQTWSATAGKNQKTIELNELPAGVYVVDLKTAYFSVHTQLVTR